MLWFSSMFFDVLFTRYTLGLVRSSKCKVLPWSSEVLKRNAGHSKWANIKHTKALKDAQRANTFTKLGRLMMIAIRDGGSPDPNSNVHLARVIEQAKRHSMPSATVQSIIKSAQSSKDTAKPAVLEFRGPGGCVIIADILTDNFSKTKQTIATILRKNNAIFSDGGIRHLFDHKGVIEAEPVSSEVTSDTAVDHAIEAGAEDVTPVTWAGNRTVFRFICEAGKKNTVHAKLKELKYNIELVDEEFIPKVLVQLSDSELDLVGQLCDKLQANSDIVRLYDNIA